MCNLETIFPPSFFDLMPHLLVHIVHKMKYLGHVFLHQMYPFERFMSVLKKYVHNRSRPKGCMVQGGAKEKLLSSLLIIWISKQLASLFRAMKVACLGTVHEITLLSMSIMSHTPKHISYFYNNPFQSLPMSECMSKCYDAIIQRSPKTRLQGNSKTISVAGYVIKLWIRTQVFNWLTRTLMT
jgi:hypothetical protein